MVRATAKDAMSAAFLRMRPPDSLKRSVGRVFCDHSTCEPGQRQHGAGLGHLGAGAIHAPQSLREGL
jgi:hypothetical protein